MKDLMLCGHTVRIDDQGLVSLTDMWKASGSANKNRPSFFLKNDRTRSFLIALDDFGENTEAGNPALKITKGGVCQGTWADEIIAYKYAGWIDPKFEVGAYRVLRKFFHGEMVDKDSWQALHDFVVDERISRKLGSFHGKGLSLRRAE